MPFTNFLKNFMPMDIMFKLKYHNQLKMNVSLNLDSRKHIFFLDAPDYGNIGDQAIALAICRFAKKYFPQYEFVEILQKDIAIYLKWLKNNITNEDVIFLTGGGNMGNYYRIYEATRREIIKTFTKNQIVIFPQSMMYTNDLFGRLSIKKAKSIYNNHPNLIVCARERDSFIKMKNAFKHVIMCPDIVLSLAEEEIIKKPYVGERIGICLRNDIEQKLTCLQKKEIVCTLKNVNQGVFVLSTVDEYGLINAENREDIVMDKIKQISQCSVLVTDRLHAMIFAIITKTPCLVFNINNSKIIGTIEWLNNYTGVKLITNTIDLRENVLYMLEKKIKGSVCPDYSELIGQIGKING